MSSATGLDNPIGLKVRVHVVDENGLFWAVSGVELVEPRVIESQGGLKWL